MSKKTTHTNASRAVRVLPDGTAVPPKGDVQLSADVKRHPIVASWLKAGVLVPVGAKAAPAGDGFATGADAKALSDAQAAAVKAEKALADAAAAWGAARASLEADEGTDEANALNDRMAALDVLLPAAR